MGKKKFIDKKRSTTYYLSNGPAVSEQEQGGGPAQPPLDDGYPLDDPELAALLGMEGPDDGCDYQLTEERRREILELGFPDDGYDYLRHLRDPMPAAATKDALSLPVQVLDLPEADSAPAGPSAALVSAEAPAAPLGGPYVFIPASKFTAPSDDTQFVDARQLRVAETVVKESDADAASVTVSAFTRSAAAPKAAADAASAAVSVGLRGRLIKELAELEESMTRLEADGDDQQQEREANAAAVPAGGGEGSSAAHQVTVEGDEEWADWLDEFVVMASAEAVRPAATAGTGARLTRVDESHEPCASDSDEDSGSWVGSEGSQGEDSALHPEDADGVGSKGRRAAGSIASTYWRPERHDRGGVLENIDEHFENLALQYNDEEFGELEEEEVADRARGTADISMYESVLDEYLLEERTKRGVVSQPDAGQQQIGARQGDAATLSDDDDSEDIRAARYEARRAQSRHTSTGKANKVECFDQRDPEALAATRARLAACAAEGPEGEGVSGDVLLDTLQTVVIDRGERWDCESVLSLRSNLDNHPARIVEPQRRTGARGGAKISLSHKTGMPVVGRGEPREGCHMGVSDPIEEECVEQRSDGDSDDSDGSDTETLQGAGVVLERRRGETAEEKRARKAAVKDAQRASRAAKKELKTMFKSEAVKQKKSAAGKGGLGGAAALGSSTYTLS